MKKFLLLLIACISISGYAQVPDLPQVFSPDAAELGKYGKIPVNYFNGLPSITIPLTEFHAKNYTLPVYLSYHASGNKPENHPGWVGQGWTLHAGGCINRIIRGTMDEALYLRIYKAGAPGYLYHANQFQSINWNDTNSNDVSRYKRKYLIFPNHYYEDLDVDDEYARDYEPDEFQINIEDINASFYLMGDGKVKIVSKSDADFTVTYTMNDYADTWSGGRILDFKYTDAKVMVYDTFHEFIVTKKDGTRYHFGGKENAIEYSMNHEYLGGNAPGNYRMCATANTWMLTKIERPDGEEIFFNYKRGGVPIVRVDSQYFESSVTESSPVGAPASDGISFYFLLPSYPSSISCKYGTDHLTFHSSKSVELGYKYDKELFRRKVQGQIDYNSMKAQDYYLKLDSIRTNHAMIKCDYTKSELTRLKLDSVRVVAGKNDPIRYKLKYDMTHKLPEYNSRKTDPWGYYNTLNSYECYPWNTLFDRRNDVKPDLLQAEMLIEIKYPTGGRTCFEYEPHDYSKVVTQFPFGIKSESGRAGGLRIKKMTDYPIEGIPEERIFTYSNLDGQSSGILSGKPEFYIEPTVHPTYDFYYNYNNSFLYTAFSEHALNQLSDTDGNHVTYSRVIEIIPGSGKTEYRYSNHDSNEMACMDEDPTIIFNNFNNQVLHNPYTSRSLSRGLLLKKATYNKNGILVMEEDNTYDQDLDDHIFSLYQYVSTASMDICRRSLTRIYTFYPALTRKVVKMYPTDGGSPSEETTAYSYNSHRQLTKIVRRNSSSSEETRMTYSGDMPKNKSPYGEMQAAGIFDRPVEQTVLRGIPVISSSLITYRKIETQLGDQFVPDKYYESRLSSPIPSHHSNEWSPYNGEFKELQQSIYGVPRITFDSYDSYGNILSATDEGGRCSRYFWDQKGLKPEASISGMMSSQEAWYYSFEADGRQTKGFYSNKAGGSPTFAHAIPSGVPYTIDWMERGSDGRWTYHSDAFTGSMSFLGKVIDNVRIYPSSASATNWTWTSDGELRSVTDGIGMTTSYKYDGMGRLAMVFDADENMVASYEYHYASPSAKIPDSNVKARQYTDATGASATETIRYHDGLGRPWQTVSLNAGRNDDGKPMLHLCELTDYDTAGRPYRNWLPFRTTSENPQTEVPSSERTLIYSDNEPFSYVEYDGSPLDRPVAKYGPGKKWHTNGKAVRYEYMTNKSAGLLKVTNYRIGTAQDTTVTVLRSGKHTFGTLSVKSVTDEDGLTLLTFTDLYGRTVLERRHPASGEDLDTYYVYDAMGRLAAVMPPVLSKKAESSSTTKINSAEIDKYAYLYTYDANGNCTAKKLPGCGWTRYIYDKGNCLVFSQDAENRRMGRWMFSFSDIYGRSCVSGYCEGNMETLKQAVSATNVVATRQGNASGPYMGYSVSGLSLTDPVVLSVSYYDDYSFIDSQVPSAKRSLMTYGAEYGLSKWDYVHGLQTGSAERILGDGVTNDFRWNTCYYDKKGNLIQTHTTRADGGVDVATTEVTFTGRPKRTHISHDHGRSGELNEFYEYTYDNWERPLTVTHRLGENADPIVLSDIKYDGIGRVQSVDRNEKSALKTTFTYNVRSWNKSNTGPGLTEVMSYEDGGQWGGNISGINWSAGTGSEEFQDSYSYDGMSRLRKSTRNTTSDPSHRYVNEYTYDAQSNIVQSNYKDELNTLREYRINSLTSKVFNHDGNRLVSGIITTGTDNQQVSYAYDRNGRLTLSEDQGMTGIQYNAVGYPSLVETEDGGYVQNKYTAGGTRLESRRMDANNTVTTMAYEGNEVIENGHRRMIQFDGGYVDFSGSEPRYCWYTKDHLGSVRAVADADGNVFSTYAYDPYGEDFAVEFEDSNLHEMGPVGGTSVIYPGIGSQIQGPTTGISGPITGNGSGQPTVTFSATADSDWQPFKFSGKESLTRVGLDLYDFGARMYSPSNMRWMTMDPFAEKYYHISPYVYCAGDPINLVDPDGCMVGDYYNTFGVYIGTDGIDDKKKYLVVDNKEAKTIQKNTKEGKVTPKSEVSSAVSVPSNETVAKMDEAYKATEKKKVEHGFRLGQKGTLTSLAVGDPKHVDMTGPRDEITAAEDIVALEAHTHPEGTHEEFGAAEPSTDDKKGALKTAENIVLGYRWVQDPQPSNRIGGEPTFSSHREVRYFNQSGPIGDPIPFDQYRLAAKRANKEYKKPR